METILGLILLVLDIIALISVINSSYGAVKKLIWIIVIIALPLLGLILWYLLGNPGKQEVEVSIKEDD